MTGWWEYMLVWQSSCHVTNFLNTILVPEAIAKSSVMRRMGVHNLVDGLLLLVWVFLVGWILVDDFWIQFVSSILEWCLSCCGQVGDSSQKAGLLVWCSLQNLGHRGWSRRRRRRIITSKHVGKAPSQGSKESGIAWQSRLRSTSNRLWLRLLYFLLILLLFMVIFGNCWYGLTFSMFTSFILFPSSKWIKRLWEPLRLMIWYGPFHFGSNLACLPRMVKSCSSTHYFCAKLWGCALFLNCSFILLLAYSLFCSAICLVYWSLCINLSVVFSP